MLCNPRTSGAPAAAAAEAALLAADAAAEAAEAEPNKSNGSVSAHRLAAVDYPKQETVVDRRQSPLKTVKRRQSRRSLKRIWRGTPCSIFAGYMSSCKALG